MELVDWIMLINQGKRGDIRIDKNGVMRFRGRVCVPNMPELKKRSYKWFEYSSRCH